MVYPLIGQNQENWGCVKGVLEVSFEKNGFFKIHPKKCKGSTTFQSNLESLKTQEYYRKKII